LLAADALNEKSPVPGRAYFISQGEPVNCWAWLNEIITLAGLPPIQKSIPAKLAWYLGASCEIFNALLCRNVEPRMTRFLAAQLATSHYYDISRAKRDFGYQPKISISEGMQRLVAAGFPCQ
jgi:nucleoside-diphosphate-sugar epimerase